MKLNTISSALMIGMIPFLFSCKKENEKTDDGQANLTIAITDAPGDYAHIYLEVEEISVKNSNGWQIMPLNQTDTFDILDYTNGSKLILSDGTIAAGTTSEIRLVLGANNILVLNDSTEHALFVPSGYTSGLKIKLDSTVSIGANQNHYVVLDFNASKSIIKKGNGQYQLKPVIRAFWETGSGEIEGAAISQGHQVYVSAINNNDTISGTIADSNGYFKIIGLPEATYELYYESTNFNDTLVGGFSVTNNNVTVADTVLL